MSRGDRDAEWMAKLDADYDCHDPLVYRATWAEENSADDIPGQIESWRRESAKFAVDVTDWEKHEPLGSWIRARMMHAMADQMKWLWEQHTKACVSLVS